jgi:hypothetical protein
MQRRADELVIGDVFRLHVYGEVLASVPVAGGKRIKVKLGLEDQGRRRNSGAPTFNETRKRQLEFTDAGHTLEFICLLGHVFHLTEWWDDDSNGDDADDAPGPVLSHERAAP